MVKFFKKTVVKSAFVIGAVSTLLTSCGGEEVKHSNYIPANACVVLNINTQEIFSDAFFDLIANNDLTDDLAAGPLSEMIKDPANAGIERLTKYHFFATGANFFDGKMGAILPLSDSEQLAKYATEHFDVEVLEDNGFLIAEISGGHNLVWNENTAIYYYGAFGGDLITEAEAFFKQSDNEALATKDSTFAYALNNDAHVSAWFKNDDFVAFIDEGLQMAVKFKLFESLNVDKEDIAGAKSVFLANFNNGNITVNQRQYLNPTQMNIYNGFDKVNNLSALTPMAGNEDPMAMFSASLKSEGLVDLLKEYSVDKAWDKQMQNSPIKIKMEQLAQFFEGDVLILLNEFNEVTKEVEVPDLNDEGEDIMVKKEVKQSIPQVSVGLTVKDPSKFKMFMGMFASALPKVDGFSSFNDDLYFAMKGDYFFLTTTPQGITALNNMKGKLKADINALAIEHRTSSYLNVGGLLTEAKKLMPFNVSETENLKNIVISEKGVAAEGIIEGETKINFNNDDNGLISTFKLFNGLGNAFGPLLSMYL